jgi:biopolymer transport protein ExbB
MITTFRLMTLFGAGDPNAVSSGISEALVTTELGLVVAIPALLAHALLSRKVKAYFAQLENDAVNLSRLAVEPAYAS